MNRAGMWAAERNATPGRWQVKSDATVLVTRWEAGAGLEIELVHLRCNPSLEFFEVNRWQIAQVGPKSLGSLGVDVPYLILLLGRIPLNQDADAMAQRSGNTDFIRAKQRDIDPA
jgi:hypothetical protein